MNSYKNMRNIIEDYLNSRKKLEFSITELEKHILNHYRSLNDYRDEGGYEYMYSVISDMHKANEISPIKTSIKQTNNRKQNALPVRWKKEKTKVESSWSKEQMFQVSDRLDISYYIDHPEYQDHATWEYIYRIHEFLGYAEGWEWESNATRSYQLFNDEKFLRGMGRSILSRLKLTEADLRIKQFGEPFSYIVNPKIVSLSKVQNILVIENLSFFHSCRRLFRLQRSILGVHYDMIIYAEGTHIEFSIQYLEDVLEQQTFEVHYVGDMDPSGYSIYARLKEKNPQYKIKLAKHIYYKMVEQCRNFTPIPKEQTKNHKHFLVIMNEVRENEIFRTVATELWDENRRIPQEVLPIDVLLKEG